MIKKIITAILSKEAQIALKRARPVVIGITGSSGKSSTKEAVAAVLQTKFSVRKSIKSYNSELGLALAILGKDTAWRNPLGWLKNMISGFKEIWAKNFPEILVLEMGVDRPHDLERLIKIARPAIGIVTAIGEIPVHVEFFAGPEEIAAEKAKLIKNLPSSGHAILNFDDAVVMDMKNNTRAHVVTFGFGDGADISASNSKISLEGLSFKVDYNGSSVPIRVKNSFGKHYVYSLLAAVAVGIIYEMNLIQIAGALSGFKPLPARLNLIPGIKDSLILDDSYNASPLATHAALDTLQEITDEKIKRKIVVFGDMLEIGKYTIEAHKAIGEKVAKTADCFVTVGPRAKFAGEEAVAQGMDKSRVSNFSTSHEAAIFIKELVKSGDLILVKGSQAMRMERVVEEVMAEPDRVSELLCRQDQYWKNKE